MQEVNQEEEKGNMAAFNFCFNAIKRKIYLKKILVIYTILTTGDAL